jgi:hypothetical protein
MGLHQRKIIEEEIQNFSSVHNYLRFFLVLRFAYVDIELDKDFLTREYLKNI